MNHKEEGFTLLETLFVLTILSAFFLFPALSIDEVIESTQIDLFFRELTSKVTQMQTHAVLNGEMTEIEFVPELNTIRFYVRETDEEDHYLNAFWELDNPYYKLGGTHPQTFTFKRGTGNITSSRKVHFDTTKGRYELVYYLGSGRFEIRERQR
ncbi:MAG TPA: competence type IV pilus minor pilin ComGD [Atopostipes sp.]|nr:competence type IV pilus minor pilin ComGD [Atopostipes sp.]